MNTKKVQSTQRREKYHTIYFLVSPFECLIEIY